MHVGRVQWVVDRRTGRAVVELVPGAGTGAPFRPWLDAVLEYGFSAAAHELQRVLMRLLVSATRSVGEVGTIVLSAGLSEVRVTVSATFGELASLTADWVDQHGTSVFVRTLPGDAPDVLSAMVGALLMHFQRTRPEGSLPRVLRTIHGEDIEVELIPAA